VPLWEIFYFNLTKTHVDVFSAQPRESHKTAFRNPAHWLHCACCARKSPDEDVKASQPDTSILHELYLESTAGLINLYDWFGAFREVKGDDGGLSEEELLASFMAGLDELVWMGYVKRTLRKTDHVEKLIGG
jgi:origin recognition complex subunit 3